MAKFVTDFVTDFVADFCILLSFKSVGISFGVTQASRPVHTERITK